MKINLAVYTAIHGYDWQPGTVYPTSDLVRYKRGIGRLPDPLMEELPFGGVFNDGDTVVFYRYHMAIKSDAKGRDSLYLVLGTLPKAEIGKVDFKYLFALSEFAKPMKPAPAQATYIGSAASGTPPDFSVSFRRNLRGGDALSEIGSWFSRVPEGTLSMRISGTYADPIVNVQYDKPHTEEPKKVSSIRPEMSPQPMMPNRPAGFQDYKSGSRFTPQQQIPSVISSRQSLLLPIFAALLVGGVVGWYARSAKDWISDKVRIIQEKKTSSGDQPPKPAEQPPTSVAVPPITSPDNSTPQVVAPTNAPQMRLPSNSPTQTEQQASTVKVREKTSDLAKEGIPDASKPLEEVKDFQNEKDCSSRR